MAAQYSYIGSSGEVVVLADTSINFTGAWSGTTSYAKLDSVTYNSRRYIAVTPHTGVTPPTEFVISTPTYWSPLVLVEGDPTIDDTNSEIVSQRASALATLALETAWAGTEAASVAQALAAAGTDAANAAWDYAGQAWTIAVTGTNAADQAYSLALQALYTAWTGTDTPTGGGGAGTVDAWVMDWLAQTYNISVSGTEAASVSQSAADAAYSLAQQALAMAWVGTDTPVPTGGGDGEVAYHAFSIAVAGTTAADQNYALIQEARLIAEAGTGAAANAENFALDALNNAATAQGIALNALDYAWTGTLAADQAYSLAQQALAMAWVGTDTPVPTGGGDGAVAYAAYNIAVAGTNAANQVNTVAFQAYNLAVTGTHVADQAFGAAAAAIYQVGTISTQNVVLQGTIAPSIGTVVIDFAADPANTTTLYGDTVFVGTNYAAGRSVTTRIISDGTLRNLTFPAWVFMGLVPSSIPANKTGIVSAMAWGSTDSDITAAWAVQS